MKVTKDLDDIKNIDGNTVSVYRGDGITSVKKYVYIRHIDQYSYPSDTNSRKFLIVTPETALNLGTAILDCAIHGTPYNSPKELYGGMTKAEWEAQVSLNAEPSKGPKK